MIKSAFIYLFGGVLNKAIPFLLLPVLTRYLSPDEYGTLAIFQVLLAITVPFVGMNIQNNISRNFGKMEYAEMGKLLGTMAGLLGVTGGFVGVFLAIWVAFGGTTLGLPGGWIMVLPLVAVFSMAHQFNLTVLRNQQRPVAFGAYEISNTAFDLSLSLILVVGFGFGWQGRAAGVVIAASCFGIVGLLALRRQKLLVYQADRSLVAEVLRISLPLIPHALGSVVIAMSDRLFIDRMVGKEAVGLYAVGYTFGMIINLVVEAFNRAWGPWFYREMNNVTGDGHRRIVKYTYIYFGTAIVAALMITGASYFVLPYMVTAEYLGASQFIMWVSLGYAFRGMYTMVFPYLVHVARTSFLGVITAAVALLNLPLNYILIKGNGVVGAAQATLICFIVSFVCVWWYANRVCPMPWRFWRQDTPSAG